MLGKRHKRVDTPFFLIILTPSNPVRFILLSFKIKHDFGSTSHKCIKWFMIAMLMLIAMFGEVYLNDSKR